MQQTKQIALKMDKQIENQFEKERLPVYLTNVNKNMTLAFISKKRIIVILEVC